MNFSILNGVAEISQNSWGNVGRIRCTNMSLRVVDTFTLAAMMHLVSTPPTCRSIDYPCIADTACSALECPLTTKYSFCDRN